MTSKKILKSIMWTCLVLFLIPLGYLLVAYVLSNITVERLAGHSSQPKTKVIYLHTNGAHLDIALRTQDIHTELLSSIALKPTSKYLSFGWGDENFYLNTPTWSDLTAKSAINALFIDSSALIHVTHYQTTQANWIAIPVSNTEFEKLNQYIQMTFKTTNNQKIRLIGKGYSVLDDFYKAKGSYSLIKTCNTWVNSGFKYSGLRASLWTPFNFGLINQYQ